MANKPISQEDIVVNIGLKVDDKITKALKKDVQKIFSGAITAEEVKRINEALNVYKDIDKVLRKISVDKALEKGLGPDAISRTEKNLNVLRKSAESLILTLEKMSRVSSFKNVFDSFYNKKLLPSKKARAESQLSAILAQNPDIEKLLAKVLEKNNGQILSKETLTTLNKSLSSSSVSARKQSLLFSADKQIMQKEFAIDNATESVNRKKILDEKRASAKERNEEKKKADKEKKEIEREKKQEEKQKEREKKEIEREKKQEEKKKEREKKESINNEYYLSKSRSTRLKQSDVYDVANLSKKSIDSLNSMKLHSEQEYTKALERQAYLISNKTAENAKELESIRKIINARKNEYDNIVKAINIVEKASLKNKKTSEKTKEISLSELTDKKKYDTIQKYSKTLTTINGIMKESVGISDKKEMINNAILSIDKDILKTNKELNKLRNTSSQKFTQDELNARNKTRALLNAELSTQKQIKATIEGKLIALNKEESMHKSISQKIHDGLVSAVSFEKAVNRASFVATATLSYTVFDFITSSIKEGISASMELERSLARIKSITRGQDIGILRESALGSVKKYGMKISDVNEAQYLSASSMFTNEETRRLMDISGKMAVAGFTSQTEALDALTTVLNAYNMRVDEAGKVSDWFFSVIKLGKTTLGELAPNIGKITSSSALLGINLDEVGTALSTMTMKGLKTNVAITSLNQLLLNLAKPSQEAIDIYKKYNLNMDLSAIKTRGFAETIKQLNVLTDSEIETIASSNKGFRALAIALADTTRWNKNYNEIINNSGETLKAFNDQSKTTGFRLEQLKGEFISLGLAFGDVVNYGGALVGLLKLITSGLNTVAGKVVLASAGVVGLGLAVSVLSNKISKLDDVSKTSIKRFAIITGLVITASTVLGIYSEYQERALNLEKERDEAQRASIAERRSRLKEEISLLKTLQMIKDDSFKKGITQDEKDKLRINTLDALAKKYKYTSDNVKDYVEKLEGLEKADKSLFELQKQRDLVDARKQMAYTTSSKNNVMFNADIVASSFKNYAFGSPETARDIQNKMELGYRNILKDVVNNYNTGNQFNAKGRLNAIENYRNNFRKEQDKMLALYNSLRASTPKEIAFKNELDNQYRLREDIFKSLNERFLNQSESYYTMLSSSYIPVSGIQPSGGMKRASSEHEYSKILDTAIAKFKNDSDGIQELIKARDEYLVDIKKLGYSPEEIKFEKEDSLNKIKDTITVNANKDIRQAKESLNLSKTQDEFDNNYNSVINAYKKAIENIRRIKDTKLNFDTELSNLMRDMEQFEDKQNNSQQIEMFKRRRKEQGFLLSAQGSLSSIGINQNIGTMSTSDIDSILSSDKYVPEDVSFTLEKRKKMLEDKIEKLKIESQKTKATPIQKFFGVEDTDVQKKSLSKLISDSNLPAKDKEEQINKINEKEKDSSKVIMDEAGRTISALSKVWDAYYNNRLQKIEENKRKEIEATEKKARFSYRSSLWVENEKAKIDKKAEQERRKLAKMRKASMIADATATYALGVANIWAKELSTKSIYGTITASLLTALLTAQYTASLATISMQKFGKGGIVKGRSHSNGGEVIEVEGEEGVLSRKAMRGNSKYFDKLQSSLESGRSLESILQRGASDKPLPANKNNVTVFNDMSVLSSKLDAVVGVLQNMNPTVNVTGQFLNAPQIARLVDFGNKKRSIL